MTEITLTDNDIVKTKPEDISPSINLCFSLPLSKPSQTQINLLPFFKFYTQQQQQQQNFLLAGNGSPSLPSSRRIQHPVAGD